MAIVIARVGVVVPYNFMMVSIIRHHAEQFLMKQSERKRNFDKYMTVNNLSDSAYNINSLCKLISHKTKTCDIVTPLT